MMYHKLHHWKNISPSEVRGWADFTDSPFVEGNHIDRIELTWEKDYGWKVVTYHRGRI